MPCASAGVDLNRNYGACWGGNGREHRSDRRHLPRARRRSPSPRRRRSTSSPSACRSRTSSRSTTSPRSCCASRGSRPTACAPDEARLKELGDRMGAATGYDSQSATSSTRSPARPRTGTTSRRARSATRSSSGRRAARRSSRARTRRTSSSSTSAADTAPAGGEGVREALLLAGEQAGDARDHARPRPAPRPPGARCACARASTTATSRSASRPTTAAHATARRPIRALALDDCLDTTLTVPASGRFEWHVGPSTRPFERKAGRTEAWTLTCEAGRPRARRAPGRRRDRRAARRSTRASAGGLGAGGAGAAGRGVGGSRCVLARRQRRATVLRRGVLVRATCAADCTLGSSVRRSAAAPGPPCAGSARCSGGARSSSRRAGGGRCGSSSRARPGAGCGAGTCGGSSLRLDARAVRRRAHEVVPPLRRAAVARSSRAGRPRRALG